MTSWRRAGCVREAVDGLGRVPLLPKDGEQLQSTALKRWETDSLLESKAGGEGRWRGAEERRRRKGEKRKGGGPEQ